MSTHRDKLIAKFGKSQYMTENYTTVRKFTIGLIVLSALAVTYELKCLFDDYSITKTPMTLIVFLILYSVEDILLVSLYWFFHPTKLAKFKKLAINGLLELILEQLTHVFILRKIRKILRN